MYPGTIDEGWLYDSAKGNVSVDGVTLSWDFTDGLTKEQWLRRRELQEGRVMIVTKSGRILMPFQGIY